MGSRIDIFIINAKPFYITGESRRGKGCFPEEAVTSFSATNSALRSTVQSVHRRYNLPYTNHEMEVENYLPGSVSYN